MRKERSDTRGSIPAGGALDGDMLTCRSCGGLTPIEAASECLHCDAPLVRAPRWARRLSGLLGPAGAILLAACYGGPGRYRGEKMDTMPSGMTRSDRDHDGVRGGYECLPDAADCAERRAAATPPPEVDCDDGNAAVFPGAADVDGDGVDSNCDGVDGWADEPKAAAPAAEQSGVPPAGGASPPAVIARPPATP